MTDEVNKAWKGRTDERLADEISKLSSPEKKKNQTLGPARSTKSIEASIGIGKLTVADVGTGSGSGGGIAPPLTEEDVSQRVYWDDQVSTSSDGLFTIEVSPIQSITLMDANGNPVVINFAEPNLL
jgi:hypothetical protein